MSEITSIPQPPVRLFDQPPHGAATQPEPKQPNAKLTTSVLQNGATTSKLNIASPVCRNCKTHTTPLWRRDETGQVLCNACGLFLKLHGRPRPISLKTDTIKSRNRIKQSGSANGTAAGHGPTHKLMPNTPELRAKSEKKRVSLALSPKHLAKRKLSGEYTPLVMKPLPLVTPSFLATPHLAPHPHHHPHPQVHAIAQPLHYPNSVPPLFPLGLRRITLPLLLLNNSPHDHAAANVLENMLATELGPLATFKREPGTVQGVSLMAQALKPLGAGPSLIFSAVMDGSQGQPNQPQNQPQGQPQGQNPGQPQNQPPNQPNQPPNQAPGAPLGPGGQPPLAGAPGGHDDSSSTAALKTRILELELVNDLYRTRIMELEAMEQALQMREQLMRKRLDEMMALANMQGVVPVTQQLPQKGSPQYSQPPQFTQLPQKHYLQLSPPLPQVGHHQPHPPTLPSVSAPTLPTLSLTSTLLPSHSERSPPGASRAPPTLPSIGGGVSSSPAVGSSAGGSMVPPTLPAIRLVSSPQPQQGGFMVLPSMKRPSDEENDLYKKPKYL